MLFKTGINSSWKVDKGTCKDIWAQEYSEETDYMIVTLSFCFSSFSMFHFFLGFCIFVYLQVL